jgi:hypothetical protein
MNRFSFVIVLLLSCWLCAGKLLAAFPEVENARQRGAQGQMTLRIMDSNGKPVEKAQLSVAFYPSDSYADVVVSEGQTDTNGLYRAEGKTVGDVTYTVTKEGFYRTRNKYLFYSRGENCVQDGRWQPWNPTNSVVLKEKRSPVAMNAKNVDVVIPVQGTPIGFDLEESDWVAPYGQGRQSDLVFLYTATYEGPQTFSKRLMLTFSKAKDGLQVSSLDRSTEFMSVYDAAESGYDSTLMLERERTRTNILKSHELGKDQYFVFRVRTVTDKEGKIIGANYGKVYGPIEYGRMAEQHRLTFTYYFNPSANDRNLEFDPSQNLFTDLPSAEQVKDP